MTEEDRKTFSHERWATWLLTADIKLNCLEKRYRDISQMKNHEIIILFCHVVVLASHSYTNPLQVWISIILVKKHVSIEKCLYVQAGTKANSWSVSFPLMWENTDKQHRFHNFNTNIHHFLHKATVKMDIKVFLLVIAVKQNLYVDNTFLNIFIAILCKYCVIVFITNTYKNCRRNINLWARSYIKIMFCTLFISRQCWCNKVSWNNIYGIR